MVMEPFVSTPPKYAVILNWVVREVGNQALPKLHCIGPQT